MSDLSRLLYKEKIESYIKRLDAVIAPEEASRTKIRSAPHLAREERNGR